RGLDPRICPACTSENNYMIDATVAQQVGCIRHCGTTACHVNHINAGRQARQEAGAQRTLEGVGCSRWVDGGHSVGPSMLLRFPFGTQHTAPDFVNELPSY